MAVLGVSSLTPAFPAIAEALALSPERVGWLIAAFTLPGVLFTPVIGVLGDRVGRRRTLVPALGLFAVAGAACGFARDFETLLALRFVQGTGAAALGVINVTLVGDLYSGHRRATVMGYNATVLAIGTRLYPAVGGGLALVGWRYPFFLPVLALPIALMVLLRLRVPEPRSDQPLGTYLTNALRLVRGRSAVGLFFSSFAVFTILYGAFLTYLPFLLKGSFGASPLVIGMVMSGTSVMTGISSLLLGTLTKRVPQRALVTAGFLLYLVSMVGIPLAPTIGALSLPVALFGIANGITIPSVLTLVSELAPASYRAAFMSVNGMVLRMGQTAGPICGGLLLGWGGLPAAFYGTGVFSALALAVYLVTVKPAVATPPNDQSTIARR